MTVSRLFAPILRHPFLCMIALVVMTACFAAGLPRMTIDTSIQSLISDKDAHRDEYIDFINLFGSDRTTILLVEDPDIWSIEKLQAFEDLHYDLGDMKDAVKVESLINVSDVHDEDGDVASGALLDPLPYDDEEATTAREHALKNPLFPGQYISDDGKGLVIIVTTPSYILGTVDDVSIDEEMDAVIANYRDQFERITIIGGTRLNSETTDVLVAEMPPMFLFLIVMLIGGMWLSSKRPQAFILPLITATLSTVITFGFLGWTGIPLNMLGSLAPVLLLALGSTEDMHFFASYMEGLRKANSEHPDLSRPEYVKAARKYMIKHVGLPTLLTAGTSTLGFAVSSISDVPAIRDFGIMASFAIFANGVITILLAPSFFHFFGDSKHSKNRRPNRYLRLVAYILARCFDRIHKKPSLFVVPFASVCILGAIAASQVEVSNNPLDALTPSHPFMKDYRFSEERLGGLEGLTILIDGQRPHQISDPEALAIVHQISTKIEQLPGVTMATSLADQLAHINHVWGNPDTIPPETSEQVAQFLMLLERSDIESYVTRDFRYGTIKVKHTISDTKELLALISQITALLDENLPPWLNSTITGEAPLAAYTATNLISSQMQSLLILVGSIYLVMSLIFSSLKAGFAAVLPNIFVPLLTLGIMGATGLPMNPPLIVVIVVSIGIAVDDTIHMLSSYKESCRKIADPRLAARHTIRSEAAAVLTTTFALSLAFYSQAVSSLYYTQVFGILMGTALILALIIDIFLTPLLMTRLNFVGIFDLVSQRIPHSVLGKFPLFNDMAERHVRDLILTSVQKNVEPGENIIQIGRTERSMMVLLEGKAGVYIPTSNGDMKRISDMNEGDTVGEMSLLAGTPRSATVIADTPCWLIEIDSNLLNRMQLTQPYLLSRVYRNIGKILSMRLLASNESKK
ncbi:cyclic nucleotide-binding domain-containing protein [Thalassospira sp.]|uniref:cyclic nucleotide-binding domain-containing protein n=1 Tax=Thalassospira sp. TaxID=1912094 RepID=UPI003AA8CDC2